MASLSVVIPVFDEPRWIATAVADVVAAIERSPFAPSEIIIVDDGSGPETRRVLEGLSAAVPLRVLRQANAGRFAARRTGVEAARHALVLLIDSRVSIRPDALAYVGERLPDDRTPALWNAHVDIDVRGNPYARFWNALTEAAYSHYFADPRATSFGLDDFDRFPKGTTCFLAPREDLAWAMGRSASLYRDPRDYNDDTVLIRALAERARVNISPGFSCLYRARGDARRFLRHSNHRGVVFLDGHMRRGGRFMPFIVAFFPLSALLVALAAVRPRLALAAAALAPAAGAAAGVALRRPPADVAALAALGPPWALAYGAGMWRGAWKALRARIR